VSTATSLEEEILGHRLAQILSRCRQVHIDAAGAPVFVSVATEYGTRNFTGGTVSSALAAALHGTKPRAQGDAA
jgi:hypothetical protein